MNKNIYNCLSPKMVVSNTKMDEYTKTELCLFDIFKKKINELINEAEWEKRCFPMHFTVNCVPNLGLISGRLRMQIFSATN